MPKSTSHAAHDSTSTREVGATPPEYTRALTRREIKKGRGGATVGAAIPRDLRPYSPEQSRSLFVEALENSLMDTLFRILGFKTSVRMQPTTSDCPREVHAGIHQSPRVR